MPSTGETKLVESIKARLGTGKISKDTLQTDDRILARITDGIYRQPASAIRELIANAYDADATNVWIQTGIPDFDVLSIRDNGNGMGVEALARLVHHIGGSAKRLPEGADVGIVSKTDPSLSPKGRRLIGKIGIGLFSVSQLTRHFQIITKIAGGKNRLVAEIILHTYRENDPASIKSTDKRQTGEVRIKSVPAEDKASHGTEIILLDVSKQTKALLQSHDLWSLLDAAAEEDSDGLETARRKPPRYHIGRYDNGKIKEAENFPWEKRDPPEKRFEKLYQSLVDEIEHGAARPRLDHTLDSYLRMLWTLSLAAPLDYVGAHPFDVTGRDDLDVFQFHFGEGQGQATKLALKKNESIRDRLGYLSPERGTNTPFSVLVDDVELRRPIRFSDLPTTGNALKTPIMFVGEASPDLTHIPENDRGGDLSFEAYFMWTPKVVPTEHNGLLIRIADASGTLFDETFIKYQVSEQTRIRQLTAEIFIRKGLDPALNIDRESFNYAHPHYQYILKWVHRALRQIMTTLKAEASRALATRRELERNEQTNELQKLVRTEYRRATQEPTARPPKVIFAEEENESTALHRRKGGLAFNASRIFSGRATQKKRRPSESERQVEEQVKAIAQLLEAYGVFEQLPLARQEELLHAVAAILAQEGK